MLRGEQYHYNDSEVLYYETELRSYSSSSSSASAKFRITETDECLRIGTNGCIRIIESSSSSSSASQSSSSASDPFRDTTPSDDCPFLGEDACESSTLYGPLLELDPRGITPLKKIVSGRIAKSKTQGK